VDLNEIMHFTKVVEAGSFTKAAAALGVPKSTVSRKVAALEERLGARLLHRTTRKLRLTEIGEAFHNRCSHILTDLEEAELAVSETHGNPQGTLRITAPMDIGAHLLGEVIRKYGEAYPQVKVEVYLNDRLVNLVEEGFDLAIRAGKLADSGLIARKLGSASFILCATPEYLEKHGTPMRPEDLKDHRCLLFSAAGLHSNWTLIGPEGAVSIPVDGPLSTNHFSLNHCAALAGMGIGFMPVFHAAEGLEDGRLVRVLPEHRSPLSGLYAVYPSNRHLVAKVRAFLDLLVENISVQQMGDFTAEPSRQIEKAKDKAS
jgi:DNA-binding transcriptional LysR family regulator